MGAYLAEPPDRIRTQYLLPEQKPRTSLLARTSRRVDGIMSDPGGIVEKDKWMHVAVVGDGDKFRIYADGEMAAETDFQETRGNNVTYRLGGSGGETFAGLMDDYAVFTRALDEDEISLIMEGVETFLPVEPKGKLATQWADLKR